MIISPEKYADMKELAECLNLAQHCLNNGHRDLADTFLEMANFFRERIDKDDYTALDEKWKVYHKLQN